MKHLLKILSLLFVSLVSNLTFAQECTYIKNSNGEINTRFIMINGKPYAYFEKTKSLKMLKELNELDGLRKKLAIKEDIIKEKNKMIEQQQFSINLLKLNNTQPVPKKQSFVSSPEFGFIVGYTLSSLSYGLWWWSSGGKRGNSD